MKFTLNKFASAGVDLTPFYVVEIPDDTPPIQQKAVAFSELTRAGVKDFKDIDLSDTFLSRAQKVAWEGLSLRHATFNNSRIRDALIKDTDFSGASFEDAQVEYTNLHACQLSGASFWRSRLECVDFSESSAKHARFNLSWLTHVRFSKATISGSFNHSMFRQVKFIEADLSGCVFNGTPTIQTTFENSTLFGHKLVSSRPLLQVGPIGSRNAYVTFFMTEDGVYVHTGCFWGSLYAFRRKLKETHPAYSPHAMEYNHAIEMATIHYQQWKNS